MSALDIPRGLRREKFMGNAEQVLPGAAPAAQAPPALGMTPVKPGAANMLGSGSAPVGAGLGEIGVRAAGVVKGTIPPPAAPSPMMQTIGKVGKGLGVLGAGIGAVSAGNDIKDNGLGVSNGVDLATSVAGGVGAVASAPLAVGAGSLAVGKALGQRFTPDAVAHGLGRFADTMNSPVAETYDRMRAGGPFLKPELGGIAGPALTQEAINAAAARNPAMNQAPAGQAVVPPIAALGNAKAATTPGQIAAMGTMRAPAQAQARPGIESLNPNSARGLQASRNLDSRGYVPESGTGIMRNNSTGAITQFNPVPQQAAAPMSAEMEQKIYGQLPHESRQSNEPDLPSALAEYQRAVKTGNVGDIMAARAGLRQDAAQRLQDGETMRTSATLSQTSRLASATARMKQLQDDREFGLKQQQFGLDQQKFGLDGQRVDLEGQRVGLAGKEFGAKRDNEDFTQREAVDKNLTARYESQFRGADGKVDTARVAKFKTGVQTFVAGKQAELAQLVQAGKATPDQQKMLDTLNKKGMAALDEEDLTNIEENLKRGERAEQTAGLTGGTFIKSNDPNAYGIKGRKSNLFGSDTIEMNNGTTARANDLKYTEPGNTLLPNVFKTKTDEYGLKGKKK